MISPNDPKMGGDAEQTSIPPPPLGLLPAFYAQTVVLAEKHAHKVPRVWRVRKEQEQQQEEPVYCHHLFGECLLDGLTRAETQGPFAMEQAVVCVRVKEARLHWTHASGSPSVEQRAAQEATAPASVAAAAAGDVERQTEAAAAATVAEDGEGMGGNTGEVVVLLSLEEGREGGAGKPNTVDDDSVCPLGHKARHGPPPAPLDERETGESKEEEEEGLEAACPALVLCRQGHGEALLDAPRGPFIALAVCVAVRARGGQTLITRRAPHMRIFPHAWVLPGGAVDPRETLFEAGTREVKEETGLDIQPSSCSLLALWESCYPTCVSECSSAPHLRGHHLVVFLFADLEEEAPSLPLQLECDEVDAALWLSPDKLAEALTATSDGGGGGGGGEVERSVRGIYPLGDGLSGGNGPPSGIAEGHAFALTQLRSRPVKDSDSDRAAPVATAAGTQPLLETPQPPPHHPYNNRRV